MEFSTNNELCQTNFHTMFAQNLNFSMEVNNLDTSNIQKNEYNYIDDKVIKMMSKMGFQSGTGLGRNSQGILEPVNLEYNLGRRGFGHFIKSLQHANLTYDFAADNLLVEEKAYWLASDIDESDKIFVAQKNEIMSNWIKIGPRKTTILDETKYCDVNLLQEVLKAKEVFDELDALELCKARSRANPFETLKSAFFMNRAALKMANIDAATDFMFTNVDRQPEHKQSHHPYYFADICAGPGGFSEYIFWRKRWAFKGFGLTLRGDHDFKVHESWCASSETFEALYGTRDDGDVYYPDNIRDFCQKVRDSTEGCGVHFIMGDGGFSVEGQENIQEVLSRQIYICQCLIALNILRQNGHFVVKLFDLFTPFSVGLIYLMYRCFHKIAILKPNASRPANSERYLICSKYRKDEECAVVRDYMEQIVQILFEIRTNDIENQLNLDINEIVPEHIIHSDIIFLHYMKESNNRLAKKQIQGLMKLALFCRDPALFEPRQDELRSKCLTYWRLPDKQKIPLPHMTIDTILNSAIHDTSFIYSMIRELTDVEEFEEILEESEDWHCAFVTSNRKNNFCNVYIGLGRNKVYRFQRNRWYKVSGIELIRGTILFGEYVKEYCEEDEQIIRKKSLHVIDALRLGDISLADLQYQERLDLISIYCKAITKVSRQNLAQLRLKPMLQLSEFKSSELPTLNQNGEWIQRLPVLYYQLKNLHYPVNSLLLIKTDEGQSFGTQILSRSIINLPNEFDIEDNDDENDKFCLWKSVLKILESK